MSQDAFFNRHILLLSAALVRTAQNSKNTAKALNTHKDAIYNSKKKDSELLAINAKKLSDAKIYYTEFLNKFSDHELAESVSFELKYLGLDINEIPTLKHLTKTK